MRKRSFYQVNHKEGAASIFEAAPFHIFRKISVLLVVVIMVVIMVVSMNFIT